MTRKWGERALRLLGRRQGGQRSAPPSFRRPWFEVLEDRRMLANPADIVFLVDESNSDGEEFSWIADLVSRNDGLDEFLKDPARNIDPRYGLIGLGKSGAAGGHSHLIDANDDDMDSDKLFGTAVQFASVAQATTRSGGAELAWDAIEHAIAEYEFRPGAAVIFVLFRRDDFPQTSYSGNDDSDDIHTFNGTLAAMESYNVTLNAVIEAVFDPSMYATTGGIVLGVEADEADGIVDGEQIAHVVNGVTNQPVTSDVLLVSHNGSNSTTFVDTGKSILVSQTATPDIAGPNTGNYRAQSTPYAFEDISTTGTEITVSYASSPTVELDSTDLAGFSFNFYSDNYTNLFVNWDGTITFEPSSVGLLQDEVDWATTDPDMPRIAPLWELFDTATAPAKVYWQVKNGGDPTERLIVQWDNADYFLDSGSDGVTFQAVLYENGNIVFNYEDLDVSDPLYTEGRNATVGIGTADVIYPNVIPAGVFVDAAHDVNGLPGAERDFVRLAWATGGAAWNNDIISGAPSGPSSAYLAQFDAAFIESLAGQILDKHATGDVAFADDPVLEINMGGAALGSNWIADTDPILGPNFLPAGTTTLSTSNAILKNGNSMADDANTLDVFKNARQMQSADLDLSVPANLVPDGSYIVELMFSDFSTGADKMRILFENDVDAVLENYQIHTDFGKISTDPVSAPQFEVPTQPLGVGVPIVKRFAANVEDGNGLQIKFDSVGGSYPIINGLRILNKPIVDVPLTVKDVVIKGTRPGTTTPWHSNAWVSMKDRVEDGEQFRSIYTYGVNEIEVQLSKPVTSVNANKIQLLGSNDRLVSVNTAMIDSADSSKIKITFDTLLANNALLVDKYALRIAEDAFSELLDGDWANEGHMGTLDDVTDDEAPAGGFTVGDGTVGSETGGFRLHFAYLPGDYDGDGYVDGVDQVDFLQRGIADDGDGDGVIIGNQGTQDYNVWQYFYTFHRSRFLAGQAFDFDRSGAVGTNDQAHFNSLRMRADFNDDDIVNGGAGSDLEIWQANYGMSGPAVEYADGDADLDHDVDGHDFLIWLADGLQKSAWYIAPPAIAASTSGPLPTVTDVIVSGSTSPHAPHYFSTVAGFGDQLSSVPVGKADTISIVFNQDVIVNDNDLVLVGLRTANVPLLAEFDYDDVTFTATWRFTGWALADNFLLFLNDTVHNAEGVPLDGEWTNPASLYSTSTEISQFPSGDGTAGGAFAFVMTLLPGDINLDSVVDSLDQNLFIAHLQQGGGTLFTHGDFNGSGTVSSTDITYLTTNWLVNLQTLTILADLDSDNDVDNDDMAVLVTNQGMTNADWEDGDLNGDSVVDELDIDLAFAQFGLWIDVA